MKIEFDRDQLAKALQWVGSIVEKKTTMPILGNVLLETREGELLLSATDLEIGMQVHCEVRVLAEGRVCIPARNLADIVRELPEAKGSLRKADNEWMMIESGKAQFRVVGVSADEFPKMQAKTEFKFSKLRASTLRTAIERTCFAICTDEMRYNLNGAYLETRKGEKETIFRMVATDGHRLALNDHPLSDDESFDIKKGIILPRKGVMELRRLLGETSDTTVGISVTDGSAAFQIGKTMIYMRLVVGEFPDYSAVIPKGNKKKLVVDRNIFSQSLHRVSLLSEGKSKCVRLGIKKSSVHLSANSPELGEAEEDVQGEFIGDDMEIGFNARYVLDALSAVEGNKVMIELDHSQSPGIVRIPNDPQYLAVLMPMRI